MVPKNKELHYLPAFLIVMLAAFSAICIYFYFQSIRSVQDALQVQVDEASARVFTGIKTNYSEIVRELSFLTRNALLPVLYGREAASIVERQERGADFVDWFRGQAKKKFNTIAFVDFQGHELYANKLTAPSVGVSQVEEIGADLDEAASVYDIANIQASAQRFSIQTVNDQGGDRYISAMAKIKFRGKEGVAITQFAIEELFDIPSSTVYTIVFERGSGGIVFCNEAQAICGEHIEGIYPEVLSTIGAVIDTNAVVLPDLETASGTLVLRAQYFKSPDWVVISYIKSDRFITGTEETGRLALFSCFVFFIACGVVVTRLIRRIEEQNKELNDELEKAHEMQMRLMPEVSPQIQGFDIAGTCRPATHVGGDFFQYYTAGENGVVLTLADVTGHGMQAAIPTVLFSGIMQNEMEEFIAPNSHLARLNRSLHRALDRRTFVCCTMVALDTETQRLTLANGGCPYPYHYSAATRTTRELCLDGFPLGVRAGSEYDSMEVLLEPGDALVLCSDGIIEAENQQVIFGFDRTAEAIGRASSRSASAEDIITNLMRDVDQFADSAEQLDDQTIVVLKAIA